MWSFVRGVCGAALVFVATHSVAQPTDPCVGGRISVETHRVDDEIQSPIGAVLPRRDVRQLPIPVIDDRRVLRLFSWPDSTLRSRTNALTPNDFRQLKISYVQGVGTRRACKIEETYRGARGAESISTLHRDAMGRLIEVRTGLPVDRTDPRDHLETLRCFYYGSGEQLTRFSLHSVTGARARCEDVERREGPLGNSDRRQRYFHHAEGWLERSVTETPGGDIVSVYERDGSPRGTWMRLPKVIPYPDAAAFGGWAYAINVAQQARPRGFMERVALVPDSSINIGFGELEAGSPWSILRVSKSAWSSASKPERQDKFGMARAYFHETAIESTLAEGKLDEKGRLIMTEAARARVWSLLNADSARLILVHNDRQYELIAAASPERWRACVDPKGSAAQCLVGPT